MILEIQSLRKVFQKRVLWRVETVHAVSDVSFRVAPGTVFGLVGESGCGKSTTARCVAGLERPSGGRILFAGIEIGELSAKAFRPYRERIQMVFQDPLDSLNPRYTVRSTLIEPLDLHTDLGRSDKEARVLQALDLVGLRPEHLSRFPHQLSTGQQQRVGIARAVMCRPELVLLDEPTASLDVSVRGRILEVLQDLQERMGMTYVLISHDLGTVRFVCERTAVMYLGLIVESGRTAELFKSPLHPYTQTLLAARPRLRANARRREGRDFPRGEVPSPIDLPNGCLFHTRCPRVMPACREVRPSLGYVDEDREVACHLHDGSKSPAAAEPSPPRSNGITPQESDKEGRE